MTVKQAGRKRWEKLRPEERREVAAKGGKDCLVEDDARGALGRDEAARGEAEEECEEVKRIGVVITDARDLDTCLKRLSDAQTPVVEYRIEQTDYASFDVADQFAEAALHALRRGGFDAAMA